MMNMINISEIVGSLDNVNVVIYDDFSEYDPEKCNNGGCYSYTTTYTRIPGDIWSINYDTSSEFGICRIGGNNCIYSEWDEEFHCCNGCRQNPTTVSTVELAERIVNSIEKSEDGISIFGYKNIGDHEGIPYITEDGYSIFMEEGE